MATGPKIQLPNVRLSFEKVFVPVAFSEGQAPRFEATFLLDPSDKTHAKLIDKVIASANELIGEAWKGETPASFEACFQYADGETPCILGKNKFKWRGKPKDYDGYEGKFSIASSNRTRPTVVDRDLTPIIFEDGKIYSGVYVNGSISLWVQDNNYGKRINANLRAVQFVRDGDAFGVKPVDAEDEFDVVEDSDDDFLD